MAGLQFNWIGSNKTKYSIMECTENIESKPAEQETNHRYSNPSCFVSVLCQVWILLWRVVWTVELKKINFVTTNF